MYENIRTNICIYENCRIYLSYETFRSASFTPSNSSLKYG